VRDISSYNLSFTDIENIAPTREVSRPGMRSNRALSYFDESILHWKPLLLLASTVILGRQVISPKISFCLIAMHPSLSRLPYFFVSSRGANNRFHHNQGENTSLGIPRSWYHPSFTNRDNRTPTSIKAGAASSRDWALASFGENLLHLDLLLLLASTIILDAQISQYQRSLSLIATHPDKSTWQASDICSRSWRHSN
jgi:hypothetical protein